MFVYYYRLFERFGVPITALAIFTNNNPNYHPKSYVTEFMGTEHIYKFNTFKLLDYEEQELMQPGNPFSFVMQVAHGAVGKIRQENDLLDWKVTLFKKLLEAGIDKPQIKALINFIKQYVRFDNTALNDKFDVVVSTFYNKNKSQMGVVEIIQEEYRKEGKKEGLKEGIDKMIIALLEQDVLTIEQIASIADVDIAYILEVQEQANS